MPFTPAHPAIVLPFLKARYVSATGLVMGSVAPDFEYFFKLSVDSHHSHTLPGIVYFDIPVVILLSFLFHLIVKKNLIENLPVWFQCRFHDTLMVDFKTYFRNHYFIFIISAGLGAASHIFWDGFTHENGFFVQALPIYDDTVVPYQGARYPLFYALQHVSTAVGLCAVAIYVIVKKNKSIVQVNPPHLRYWVSVLVMTGLVVTIRFLIKNSDYNIGNLVVSCISGFCLALILAGFITFKKASVDSRLHG